MRLLILITVISSLIYWYKLIFKYDYDCSLIPTEIRKDLVRQKYHCNIDYYFNFEKLNIDSVLYRIHINFKHQAKFYIISEKSYFNFSLNRELKEDKNIPLFLSSVDISELYIDLFSNRDYFMFINKGIITSIYSPMYEDLQYTRVIGENGRNKYYLFLNKDIFNSLKLGTFIVGHVDYDFIVNELNKYGWIGN